MECLLGDLEMYEYDYVTAHVEQTGRRPINAVLA